ncbi:uncharacterized protein LOC134466307 isoform X2 [Engraulis encrasicolus]|uniref:uncharacterized protein LOC134466307 isoform X2 n=1 Tax=Engraulis encrasicolus TaxID=184585 RepID=UPI002FD4295C
MSLPEAHLVTRQGRQSLGAPKPIDAEVNSPTIRRGHSDNTAQCVLVCSVKNGEEVILSLYGGDDLLNQTSSPNITVDLSVSLVAENGNRSIFSCMASNPARNKTTPVNTSDFCAQDSMVLQIIGALCMTFICCFLVVAVYYAHKTLRTIKFEAHHSVEEINYADVSIQAHSFNPLIDVTSESASEIETLVQCSEDHIVYSDVKIC